MAEINSIIFFWSRIFVFEVVLGLDGKARFFAVLTLLVVELRQRIGQRLIVMDTVAEDVDGGVDSVTQ